MVDRQLAARGVRDRRVLAVMAWVPRELFVPAECQVNAYADTPLPIAQSQTISQPYIVGLMTQSAAINRTSRVLEIGTGSGYQTAILAKMAYHVWSIERLAELLPAVQERLTRLNVNNVTLIAGDGAAGYPSEAPYDAILVAAAAPKAPPALLQQLAVGARLVIPLGDQERQVLTVIRRTAGGCETASLGECRFVPFVSDIPAIDDTDGTQDSA